MWDGFCADLDELEEARVFSSFDLGVFNEIRFRNAWDTMSPPHSVLQPTRLPGLLFAAHVAASAPDSFIRVMNLVLNIGCKASAYLDAFVVSMSIRPQTYRTLEPSFSGSAGVGLSHPGQTCWWHGPSVSLYHLSN